MKDACAGEQHRGGGDQRQNARHGGLGHQCLGACDRYREPAEPATSTLGRLVPQREIDRAADDTSTQIRAKGKDKADVEGAEAEAGVAADRAVFGRVQRDGVGQQYPLGCGDRSVAFVMCELHLLGQLRGDTT
jgi:hypothetical protein